MEFIFSVYVTRSFLFFFLSSIYRGLLVVRLFGGGGIFGGEPFNQSIKEPHDQQPAVNCHPKALTVHIYNIYIYIFCYFVAAHNLSEYACNDSLIDLFSQVLLATLVIV